ncbi:uncharacterized protein LOC143196108 [Rhynchophorus ferrugineus]|uniref:uncharacterized protein LOC143196108 n=1 Tax=Rhynchophorus ferrugineus TaxID=354439 RepID=UPI003FCC5493
MLTVLSNNKRLYLSENTNWVELRHNDTYQWMVAQDLQHIYKTHLDILVHTRTYLGCTLFRLLGGALALAGLSLVPLFLYVGDTFPLAQKITILLTLTYADLFCASGLFNFGQQIEDKKSDMFEAVLNMSWYSWNESNTKTYMLLLLNIRNSVSAKVGLNMNVDRNFLLMVAPTQSCNCVNKHHTEKLQS